jgi:hypothetical protein
LNAAAITAYGRLCGFGETYAGQTERDHTALANALASGRVQTQMGI